jgi:hypothetical protein
VADFRDISAAYRKRIERRLNGLTYEQAISRGISLQRARGHKPREHVVREQRRRERGGMLESDRRFLRQQAIRSINRPLIYPELILEDGHEDAEAWAEAVELYMSFPEDFRASIRETTREAIAFKRRNRSWKWDTDAPLHFPPFPQPPGSARSRIYFYH